MGTKHRVVSDYEPNHDLFPGTSPLRNRNPRQPPPQSQAPNEIQKPTPKFVDLQAWGEVLTMDPITLRGKFV